MGFRWPFLVVAAFVRYSTPRFTVNGCPSVMMIQRPGKIDIGTSDSVPSVAEWSKAPESDASAGVESPSPVRAPVRAVTLCPYA